jgi:alpha-ketoglutarate-dependent taurine dioxygenase
MAAFAGARHSIDPSLLGAAPGRSGVLPRFEVSAEGIDLAGWSSERRGAIDAALERAGAVLFRGFDLPGASAFEKAAEALCGPLAGNYGDLPRGALGGKVYGATPYPPELPILFHHEGAHTARWPRRIAFFCLSPAAEGGETVIADGRRVFERLPAAARERFERAGVVYLRRFTPGIDVAWEAYFGTGDRAEVEERCRADGIAWEWTADGGLRIRQRRPAVIRRNGARVFFNQILLHHPACLPADVREALADLLPEDDFPRRVAWGDGSPIPDGVVAEVRGAAEAEAAAVSWRRGDLLLVDNTLAAHGRRAYAGKRRIAVAMAALLEGDGNENDDNG